MSLPFVQAPRSVVMIRPHHFRPNPETEQDNAFQTPQVGEIDKTIEKLAYEEVSYACDMLQKEGVCVHLFEDETYRTPDSVFPNNWFSTHAGGHVALYPMFSSNRQLERRPDIIEMLKRTYRIQDVIDYSGLEQDGLALEGTGAMVLDHIGRIAYAARSNRCNEIALERFCTHFNFEPIVFDSADQNNRQIYHTNVMMCVGTEFALVALQAITNPTRRAEVVQRLEENGRTIIDLSFDQVAEFAANALELHGKDGLVLALSSRALRALRPEQIAIIERSAKILALNVPTIELAGGSVRCMLGGIHLTRRPVPSHQGGKKETHV